MGQSIASGLISRFTQALSVNDASSWLNSASSEYLPTVGDRYQNVREGASPWVVQNVMSVRTSQIPLVSLINEKRPELSKIISASTLQDEAEYTKLRQGH